MPIEKTADIVVTDFKFEQLNHLRAHYQHHHSARNRSNRSADPGVESDGKRSFEKKNDKNKPKKNHTFFLPILGSDSVPTPFTVLKKADVDLVVGGKPKLYSVVIKVLPTDDVERHTSRRKFSDLLKFSKEVSIILLYLL